LKSKIELTINLDNKRNAQKATKKINTLIIYIDKNEINKKIEATIVLLYKIIRIYLELNTTFIIYLTKLYKIILILILVYIFK